MVKKVVKKVVKPVKKALKGKAYGIQIPAAVRGKTPIIDRVNKPDAYIADKILNAARIGKLGHKAKANKTSFNKDTPAPKKLSRRDEAMQIVGAANMSKVMALIRDGALQGDWDRQKYLADLFYPKGKPDRYVCRAIDEMIEINGLKDYQDNIAIVVSLAMKGEIDLDDSDLIIKMLREGKDFNAVITLTEMEERLKVLNANAPTRK